MEQIITSIKNLFNSRHKIRIMLFLIFIISIPLFIISFISQFQNLGIKFNFSSYYKDLGFSKHLNSIKNILSSSMITKRKLNNETILTNFTDENMKLIYSYQFFSNISFFLFKGNWTSYEKFDKFSEFENDNFGKISIRFFRRHKKKTNFHLIENMSVKIF